MEGTFFYYIRKKTFKKPVLPLVTDLFLVNRLHFRKLFEIAVNQCLRFFKRQNKGNESYRSARPRDKHLQDKQSQQFLLGAYLDNGA